MDINNHSMKFIHSFVIRGSIQFKSSQSNPIRGGEGGSWPDMNLFLYTLDPRPKLSIPWLIDDIDPWMTTEVRGLTVEVNAFHLTCKRRRGPV